MKEEKIEQTQEPPEPLKINVAEVFDTKVLFGGEGDDDGEEEE